jgi:hypothetical protein
MIIAGSCNFHAIEDISKQTNEVNSQLMTQLISDRHPSFKKVTKAKIIVNYYFNGLTDGYSNKNKYLTDEILKLLRIEDITTNDSIYDMVIRLNFTGKSFASYYHGDGIHYYGPDIKAYTSETIKGFVSFEVNNVEIIRELFDGTTVPYFSIPAPSKEDTSNYASSPNQTNLVRAEEKFIIPVVNKCFYKSFGLLPFIISLKENKYAKEELSTINPNWDSTEAAINCIPFFILALNEFSNEENAKYALDTIISNLRTSEAIAKNLPFFLIALNDKDPDIRKYAAMVLGKSKNPNAVEPLIDALKDDYETGAENDAVTAAIVALGNLKDSRGTEPLIEALEDKYSSRREIGEALAKINDPNAIKPLLEILNNIHSPHSSLGEDEISEAAFLALKSITKKDFGFDIKLWEEWWNSSKYKLNN